jgi:hypothetical protein
MRARISETLLVLKMLATKAKQGRTSGAAACCWRVSARFLP